MNALAKLKSIHPEIGSYVEAHYREMPMPVSDIEMGRRIAMGYPGMDASFYGLVVLAARECGPPLYKRIGESIGEYRAGMYRFYCTAGMWPHSPAAKAGYQVSATTA